MKGTPLVCSQAEEQSVLGPHSSHHQQRSKVRPWYKEMELPLLDAFKGANPAITSRIESSLMERASPWRPLRPWTTMLGIWHKQKKQVVKPRDLF